MVAGSVVVVMYPFLMLPDRSGRWKIFLSGVAGAVPEIQRERFVDQLIKELLKARISSQTFPSCLCFLSGFDG